MPGFDYRATDQHEHDDPAISARNARYGVILFFVYLAVYAGFVLLSAFWPQAMAMTPIRGINVAVLYGFGLIVGALVLALVYGVLCRTKTIANDPERGDA